MLSWGQAEAGAFWQSQEMPFAVLIDLLLNNLGEYHSHMESKNMTQINLSMKQKQTHRHREQTCGCLARWEKGGMGVCG